MSTTEFESQNILPLSKAAKIAWKSIRIRFLRSLLVTGGIILPIAFLMYIVSSDALLSNVKELGSVQLIEQLRMEGILTRLADTDAKIQTRWMVGLALLISFVGILNAMLMSVTERFREIGTMKCLGALDSFVVKLFLLESVFQGVVGTTIGVALGQVLAFGEGMGIYGGETWTLMPAAQFVRLSGTCLLVGVALSVAGAMYPAWRASRMKPVDALRSEI